MTSLSSVTSDAGASNGRVLPYRFARIEPEWQGEIAVCVGSGPSLTHDDVLACGDARLAVVNDAIRLAPWADVLYAPDGQWWKGVSPSIADGTRCFSLDPTAPPFVELLNFRSGDGLSLDPTTVKTGGHGGYQAINLAVHYRPRRIVLLGYDMQASADGRNHFFGEHPDGSHVNYDAHLGAYYTLIKPLAKLNIEIVNASRISAINAFPRVSLADALA